MEETTREKVIQFLKRRSIPVSVPQIAKATGSRVRRVREVIRAERKLSGSKVFRIGGYAEGCPRKSVGYLLGPGKDKPVVAYGQKNRPWTEEEEKLLHIHVGELPLAKIAELLARDPSVVRKKLRELGFDKGRTENIVPRGMEHIGYVPQDAVQKQWEGGHIFKLKTDLPGITGVTIHNTARRGEDRELN